MSTRRVSSLPFEKKSNTKLKKIHCCSDKAARIACRNASFPRLLRICSSTFEFIDAHIRSNNHPSRSSAIFRLIIAPVILAARHCNRSGIDTGHCGPLHSLL